MASPFSIFRKYQKAFLAIAAVLAMIVFVFADLFLSWGTTSPADSGSQVVTSWKGGQITERELSILQQRRYFLNEVLQTSKPWGDLVSRPKAEPIRSQRSADLPLTPKRLTATRLPHKSSRIG